MGSQSNKEYNVYIDESGDEGINKGSKYFILTAKKEFVFYENKLDIYNKGKLIRTVNYEDIIDVSIMKTWQNNVFISVKPMGFNIYKVSDEICTKIKKLLKNNFYRLEETLKWVF